MMILLNKSVTLTRVIIHKCEGCKSDCRQLRNWGRCGKALMVSTFPANRRAVVTGEYTC